MQIEDEELNYALRTIAEPLVRARRDAKHWESAYQTLHVKHLSTLNEIRNDRREWAYERKEYEDDVIQARKAGKKLQALIQQLEDELKQLKGNSHDQEQD